MTTYYVSTTGSDTTGDGSLFNPWKTPVKGISALNAGDSLLIRGGTYLLTSMLEISRWGTALAPITIKSYPGENALLSGDLNGNGAADTGDLGGVSGFIVGMTSAYVNLEDVEIAYGAHYGIWQAGQYTKVKNCRIHDIWGAAVRINATYCTVENSTIWRACDVKYLRLPGDWPGAITIGFSPNVADHAIIRGNTLYHNSGEAIIPETQSDILIENNTLWDNWALGIDVQMTSNSIVRGNLIYYTDDTYWWKGGTYPSHGILIANETASGGTAPGHDNQIVNNIIAGAGDAIRYWRAGQVAGDRLINVTIANNTIVESQGPSWLMGITFDAPASGYNHSGVRVSNNVVLQSTAGMMWSGSLTGVSIDHNNWSKDPGVSYRGSNYVIGNPNLLDPNHARTGGAVDPTWYGVTSTSPGNNLGASDLGIATDFAGTSRPQGAGYDMGAYEFVVPFTASLATATASSPVATFKSGSALVSPAAAATAQSPTALFGQGTALVGVAAQATAASPVASFQDITAIVAALAAAQAASPAGIITSGGVGDASLAAQAGAATATSPVGVLGAGVRMFAVEALASARSYSAAMHPADALFDTELVVAFARSPEAILRIGLAGRLRAMLRSGSRGGRMRGGA